MTKPWADQPYPLLTSPRKQHLDSGLSLPTSQTGSLKLASEMVLIHNIFIRGLNSILLQLPHISPSESTNFCIYAQSWCMAVSLHHQVEETIAFPMLEEYVGMKGLLDGNVQQHHAFESGLEEFRGYVTDVREGRDELDMERFKGLIDGFAGVLVQHLSEEIPTIMGLKEYDEKINWVELNKKLEEFAMGHSDKEQEVPFLLTNHDITYEKPIHDYFWPPFPWFINLMFRWFYVPKYAAAWKFSPCDARGRPRELPFSEGRRGRRK